MNPPAAGSTEVKSARCARCGVSFDCGRNRDACWCATMPKLPLDRLVAGAGCLCPECLAEELLRASASATGASGAAA
jgi:hypothetical protein